MRSFKESSNPRSMLQLRVKSTLSKVTKHDSCLYFRCRLTSYSLEWAIFVPTLHVPILVPAPCRIPYLILTYLNLLPTRRSVKIIGISRPGDPVDKVTQLRQGHSEVPSVGVVESGGF